MAKQFTLRKVILFLSAAGICSYSYASGFQVWGLDAASIGNYHAERAAITEDASASYYNPAGLVAIKNQQFVAGIAPTMADLRFRGTEAANTLANSGPRPVSAQGGSFKLFPFGHYAAPISDQFVFGLSAVEPFGFKTDYGNNTLLRYSSTFNNLDVYDLSPALAIAFTDKFSLGFGLDCERLTGEFDYSTTALGQANDTVSTNSGNNWAYGYHIGALYQFTPKTRVGISYQSQVVHRLSGTSKFVGVLAGSGGIFDTNVKMRMVLPPTTTISAFHAFNAPWDIMGSLSLTQWTVTNSTVLNNVGGIQDGVLSNHLQVPLIQGYQNTWNWSVGTNYHVNEKILFRAGVGYDQAPISSSNRDVKLPNANQVAVALGTHIQATNTMGFDIGWTHIFAANARINNYAQQAGDQIATTNGTAYQDTDVYGLQMKWDIL